MGTRGAIGVRINGEDKMTYNHMDSYPDGLGATFLKETKTIKGSLKAYKKMAVELKLVDSDSNPTPEDIKKYQRYLNEDVSQSKKETIENGVDWYQLLREMQGEILQNLCSGVMLENNTFIHDSLFCEWAYIINFDDDTLEVYEGFQKNRVNIKGRYKDYKPSEGDGYFACSLVKTYPLNKLPSLKKFCNDLEPEEN